MYLTLFLGNGRNLRKMNSNVFSSSGRSLSRVLTYAKSKNQCLSTYRNYSKQDNSNNATVVVYDANEEEKSPPDTFAQFKDELGKIRYTNFPLPGNVSTLEQYQSLKVPPHSKTFSCVENSSQLLTNSVEKREQQEVLQQFVLKHRYDMISKISSNRTNSVECVAYSCPVLVKKDFYDLFPTVNLNDKPLTVVTLTQKSDNDMSAWSEQIEKEREELLLNFIGTAEEICQNLKLEGYWADFIDPYSGRPYLGSFTNATMFETDERYRHFGFTIEDLGCCKVISHLKFGTQAVVGVIFTNAPTDSVELQKVLKSIPQPVDELNASSRQTTLLP